MKRNARVFTGALRVAVALMGVFLVGSARLISAQENQRSRDASQQEQKGGHGKVELLHVQGNVYMIAGAGANITVQVGNQFVIVVDSGVPQKSEEVLAAIRSVTDKHILFVIDTSADDDHTGGNENLSKAGWALPNESINPLSNFGALSGLTLPSGASIIAHINVLNRVSAPTGKESPVPSARWPTDTYETDDWRLFNGEEVYIYHPPNAHTDGDSYVLFRRSGVVSTGDIFTLASYPVISADRGGSINGLIDALNQIIELLVPEANEEGGTYVIPGHGRICDRNDVVNYRDMVTIIRAQIQALIDKGMTLEQVKAARPTLEFDGLYGARSGAWTTDMFVEAIYQELSKGKTQQQQKVRGGR
jgi:glyoxylase-like metal-dependent hydrolase (beta-lactamase superfamily II)